MIHINFRDSRPIYEQVRDGFRQHILTGLLPAGHKIPSVRELAASLAINPNTIQRAYRELETEGCICSVPGKGSFVCDVGDALSARRQELKKEFINLIAELKAVGFEDDELVEILRGGKEQ